jgi:hypothetical protein
VGALSSHVLIYGSLADISPSSLSSKPVFAFPLTRRQQPDYSPLSWEQYFETMHDVKVDDKISFLQIADMAGFHFYFILYLRQHDFHLTSSLFSFITSFAATR